jgi:hypothetical protein
MIKYFTCVECGRMVARFPMRDDEMRLCAECLVLPGWYEIPLIRSLIGGCKEKEEL